MKYLGYGILLFGIAVLVNCRAGQRAIDDGNVKKTVFDEKVQSTCEAPNSDKITGMSTSSLSEVIIDQAGNEFALASINYYVEAKTENTGIRKGFFEVNSITQEVTKKEVVCEQGATLNQLEFGVPSFIDRTSGSMDHVLKISGNTARTVSVSPTSLDQIKSLIAGTGDVLVDVNLINDGLLLKAVVTANNQRITIESKYVILSKEN